MKVKHKIIIIVIASAVPLIAMTLYLFNYAYFGYIKNDKVVEIKKRFQNIEYIVNNQEDNMKSLINDFAISDDTYKFIEDKNEDYISSKFQNNALPFQHLNMVIFLNNKGEVILSKDNLLEVDVVNKIKQKLIVGNKDLYKIDKSNNIYNTKAGMILINDKVFIVSEAPVIDSRGVFPSDGYVILVRQIDAELLDYIYNLTNISLKFKTDKLEPSGYGGDSSVHIVFGKKDSNKYIHANKIEKDIFNNASISFYYDEIDSDYWNSIYYFRIFLIMFFASILLIGLLTLIIINKQILMRLSALINFFNVVGRTKDTSLKINMYGKDEFSELAMSINNMLSQLNSAEKDLKFLSYSDKLTGLKNRTYMEEQFDGIDADESSNYFIIMGDINGLKLMNDTFGHKEGDKLISAISDIFKEKCELDDVISRWGGDEFVILVKNKEESYVSSLIDNIKEAGRIVTGFNFKISISLGYASKDEKHVKSQAVMKIAEERMYRNKLIESESSRNAIICSLLKTLNEKHTETEQHTMRIQYLSSKLGERIGLVKSELDELQLVALLHDIGKIGIPEQILKKPDKLTLEEWTVMKKHSEIGYRIAKSTPELAHIAEEILAHHEKYDGTGYPNGLKGEAIPKLSRIINIVDSFDAITHNRVYRDASSIEYAIKELERCSGAQFDPYLAKEFIHILKDNIFKEYN